MTSAILGSDGSEVALGHIDAIPRGEGREFQVHGQRIAVFHLRNGLVFATEALCPHKQGPLADGLVGGSVVMCPLHAWRFDLSTGAQLVGECAIRIYAVRLDEEQRIVLTV